MSRTTSKQFTYPARNLHGQVVHEIGRRILRGEWQSGHPLPSEENLMTELKISRTVLREAIKVLASKGLIEVRTRTGTRVRPREDWNLFDPDVLAWEYEVGRRAVFLENLTQLRMAIEPFAAELAAKVATKGEREQICQAYEKLEVTVNMPSAFIAADMEFHAAIVAATHNDLLQQLVNSIARLLLHSREITTQLPGSSQRSLPQHKAVANAIWRGDSEGARSAMAAIVNTAGEDIRKVLEQEKVYATRQSLPPSLPAAADRPMTSK